MTWIVTLKFNCLNTLFFSSGLRIELYLKKNIIFSKIFIWKASFKTIYKSIFLFVSLIIFIFFINISNLLLIWNEHKYCTWMERWGPSTVGWCRIIADVSIFFSFGRSFLLGVSFGRAGEGTCEGTPTLK